jgi:acetyl esterase/lipase
MRTQLLWPLLLALGGCQASFFGVVNTGGGTTAVASTPGLVFDPDHGLALDVHAPKDARDAPVLVFFYGGRYDTGERGWYAFVGEAFARRGIVTIVPDYRHGPDLRYPQFVEDGALAVAWARDNARQYGGDPARLFVGGHSAGAHIAALLGTDKRFLAAHGMSLADLSGVIGISGPYDIRPEGEDDLIAIFGGPDEWPNVRATTFADGDEPPFLLLHGTSDRIVWNLHSQLMAERLEAAGDTFEYKPYEGIGHIRILSAIRYPNLAPTADDVVAFIQARSSTAAPQERPEGAIPPSRHRALPGAPAGSAADFRPRPIAAASTRRAPARASRSVPHSGSPTRCVKR